MNKKWHQLLWIVLSVLFMSLLFVHSLESVSGGTGRPSSIKQVLYNFAHVPAYMVLTILLFNAIRSRTITWAIFVATAYGVFIEYVQSWNPARTASAMDVGLNIIGALLAAGMIYWWKK